MFKNQKQIENNARIENSRTQGRLKSLEEELGIFKEPYSAYIYYLDPPKSKLKRLEGQNKELRLELKALEWRLRKLEDVLGQDCTVHV